jgi:hypothetical protein
MKNTTENSPKIPPKFICEKCDYICCKKGDFNKHLHSIKHNTTNTTNIQQEFSFSCECGKGYNHRASLYNHKKTCTLKNNSNIETDNINNTVDHSDKDQLILMLIKQNSELIKETSDFKSMMMKVLENGTNNTTHTTNTTHTNSHNKAFNLNFFLNETCKDAMNIMDFVESIKFQLSDLESVGEKGYIEGMSNIIIKNLKDLDVTQRPVHCTDKKRETIYVKDEDKWEKDDDNKKMHKMVRKVQDKNFRMIQKFKEKYPNYNKASSKQSDVYNNIIIESMGGKGDNDFEKEEKIIKKISKEITIDK